MMKYPPEEIANFRALVRSMRICQKAYFKNRLQKDLSASKEYERRVDKWLEQDAEGKGLFD